MGQVTQMLGAGGPAPGERQVLYGEVSQSQPLPVGFDDPVAVVIPDHDPNIFWLCKWNKCNGQAFPTHGAECLVIIDSRNNRRVVWFDAHFVMQDIVD